MPILMTNKEKRVFLLLNDWHEEIDPSKYHNHYWWHTDYIFDLNGPYANQRKCDARPMRFTLSEAYDLQVVERQ